MFNLKNFLMATLLIFAVSVGGIAEAGIVTDRFPFWCYVDHQVDTYEQPNGRRVGYISADVDLVRVTNFRSDGWFYGDYPISGGRRVSRWFKISEICADLGYSNRGTNVKGAQRVFRTKSSSETIGSVSNNESVIVLADNGNRAQIIYRLDNGTGYKIGWVPSSSVGGGGGNSTNIKGDANNDGKVDETDINLIKAYIVGNVGDSAINKNNADVNGDGQINILDMSAVLSISKNNQNTNVSQISNENWENKIGQKLANENSTHYTKPTNPFPKSYTSKRDGSYHPTNCTWYAWGRMREVTGKSLSVRGNAGDWHNSTNWDSNLTSKCVAERTTKNGGHVVFVEYVDNDKGRVYYTECNWNNQDYKVQVANINTFKSYFKWFIH